MINGITKQASLFFTTLCLQRRRGSQFSTNLLTRVFPTPNFLEFMRISLNKKTLHGQFYLQYRKKHQIAAAQALKSKGAIVQFVVGDSDRSLDYFQLV